MLKKGNDKNVIDECKITFITLFPFLFKIPLTDIDCVLQPSCITNSLLPDFSFRIIVLKNLFILNSLKQIS